MINDINKKTFKWHKIFIQTYTNITSKIIDIFFSYNVESFDGACLIIIFSSSTILSIFFFFRPLFFYENKPRNFSHQKNTRFKSRRIMCKVNGKKLWQKRSNGLEIM